MSYKLLLLLLVIFITGCAPQPAPQEYNILLITIDTLRADHLECYGYDITTAPNICNFARNSTLFTAAQSSSSWTLPAHASMMTGLYPHEHGAEKYNEPIDDSADLLAEILSRRNYSTSAVVTSIFVGEAYGFDRGFDVFDLRSSSGSDASYAEDVTDRGIALLENSSRFFMWLHYFDVHHDYIYHDDTDFRYEKGIPIDRKLKYNRWNVDPYNLDYFEEDKDIFTSLYDGEIYHVDRHIGRLLKYLEDEDLLDTTVVVITSDHGESLDEHDFVGHDQFLYSGLIHVPLIIYSPDRQPSVIDRPVSTKEIFSTILATAGMPEEDSLFTSKDQKVFAEVDNRNQDRRVMVMEDDMKLIYTFNQDRFELYNLTEDPDELYDLADSFPELVESMREVLFDEMGVVDLDADALEQLRSLGYVD